MRTASMTKKIFLIALITGALSFTLLQTGHTAELQKVKGVIGTNILAPQIINLWIGKYLGYFEEEGIEAVWLTSGGGGQVVQWLATSQVEFGTVAPDPILFQAVKGEDMGLTTVYNMNRKTAYYMVAKADSGINTIKDLKGKKIGVFSLGHAVLPFAKFAVKEAGLDPEKDVSYIAVGMGIPAARALQDGQVDAISWWDSEIITYEELGYKYTWLPLSPLAEQIFGACVVTRDNFLKSNRSLAIGFLRAITKGTIFLIENPREAIKVHYKLHPEFIPKGKSMDQVLKEVTRGVTFRAQKGFAVKPGDEDKRWGAFTRKGWDTYLKFLGMEGKIKDPYRYYSNELIDEINKFDVEKIRAQARSFNLEEYEKKKGGK
jgi:NitT/TauT family transport system substrate-binding protein